MSSSSVVASSSSGGGDDSLSSTFYRCQREFQSNANGGSGRTAVEVSKLITTLATLLERISTASIFSTNEEFDDIPTSSLKFLLVPYYLAQSESTFPSGLSERLDHLTRSMFHFQTFAKYLEDYKIGEKKEVMELKQYVQTFQTKLKASSSASSASSSSPAPRPSMPSRPIDPNAARTAKIARFKREKELTAQLEAMQNVRRSRVSAGGSGSTIGGGPIDDELLDEASDESQLREFYTLLFQSCLLTAVDTAKGSVDEMDILLHHRDVELRKPREQQLSNLTPEERQKQIQQDVGGVNKKPTMFKMTPESLLQPIPDHMKHILQNVAPLPVAPSKSNSSSSAAAASSSSSSSVVPSTISNRIDSLVNSRAHARDEVFKLTNQPTYSIEQWAEMEIAAGHMPGPNSNPPPKQPDPRRIRSAADREYAEELVEEFQRTQMEDGEGLGHEDGIAGAEQDDLKTLKDRDWDNWYNHTHTRTRTPPPTRVFPCC